MLKLAKIGKRFGNIIVLKNVNFDVVSGESLCIVGDNGSGKTTLLKIIASILKYDRGEIYCDGKIITKDLSEYRKNVVYIGHDTYLYDYLSAYENLIFWCSLYNIFPTRKEVENSLKEVGLSVDTKQRISEFSKGMKKRVSLSKALLIKPKILIIDEPFSNLDEIGKMVLTDFIATRKKENLISIISYPTSSDYKTIQDFITTFYQISDRTILKL